MWINGKPQAKGDIINFMLEGKKVEAKITAETISGVYLVGKGVDGFFKWSDLKEDLDYLRENPVEEKKVGKK